jgi:hypothetical protein
MMEVHVKYYGATNDNGGAAIDTYRVDSYDKVRVDGGAQTLSVFSNENRIVIYPLGRVIKIVLEECPKKS